MRSNLIVRFHLNRRLIIALLLGQLAPLGLRGGRCLTDTSTGWLAGLLAGTGEPNLLRVCNDSAYWHACLRTGMLACVPACWLACRPQVHIPASYLGRASAYQPRRAGARARRGARGPVGAGFGGVGCAQPFGSTSSRALHQASKAVSTSPPFFCSASANVRGTSWGQARQAGTDLQV